MKIPGSVRKLYAEQKEHCDLLGPKVDDRLRGLKKKQWHYESRIKPAESFALKVESGRFKDLDKLEDFFACTLVVENQKEIKKAENLIKLNFKIIDRRPPSDSYTFKHSNSFPFDDLRLYVEWIDDPSLPASGITGIVFEVQIKTFLQHAWSIATHDLVYKGDRISWAKERIAYQIKAMLEHAEVSILEAEKLAKSKALRKEDKKTKLIIEAIRLLKHFWNDDQLPADVLRLANNLVTFTRSLGLPFPRLWEILKKETTRGYGAQLYNLSPYGTIVQSVINQEMDLIKKFVVNNGSKYKMLITSEIEVPPELKSMDMKNLILIE